MPGPAAPRRRHVRAADRRRRRARHVRGLDLRGARDHHRAGRHAGALQRRRHRGREPQGPAVRGGRPRARRGRPRGSRARQLAEAILRGRGSARTGDLPGRRPDRARGRSGRSARGVRRCRVIAPERMALVHGSPPRSLLALAPRCPRPPPGSRTASAPRTAWPSCSAGSSRSFEPGPRTAISSCCRASADRQRAAQFAAQVDPAGTRRAWCSASATAPARGHAPRRRLPAARRGALRTGAARARLATWRLDVRRRAGAPGGPADDWGIADQLSLTSLPGLYRLSLNPHRQFAAHDLVVTGEDLQLTLESGSVFVAEADGGHHRRSCCSAGRDDVHARAEGRAGAAARSVRAATPWPRRSRWPSSA